MKSQQRRAQGQHRVGSNTHKVCLQDGLDHPSGRGYSGGKGKLQAEEKERSEEKDAARACDQGSDGVQGETMSFPHWHSDKHVDGGLSPRFELSTTLAFLQKLQNQTDHPLTPFPLQCVHLC